MSAIHLLFLLANNPSGQDGYIGEDRAAFNLSTRIYLSKDEAESRHKDYVEEQIRIITNAGILVSKVHIDESDESSQEEVETNPE